MAHNPKPIRKHFRKLLKLHKGGRSTERFFKKSARRLTRRLHLHSPTDTFVLIGHRPVKVGLLHWGLFMEHSKQRIVKQTMLPGGVKVSTVFLGLDHSFSFIKGGPPILFETMIFKGTHDGYQDRYATWEQAEAGHKKAIELSFELEAR